MVEVDETMNRQQTPNLKISKNTKVSVLRVAALGGHFGTLFQELDFCEADSFFHY